MTKWSSRNPVLKGFPLFDIGQVEALRGPQGTLFGRNTPAGVLKFDSVKPTKDFEGYGSASYATFSTINLEGAVSGPILGDTLTGRISALYQHRDDWVDNLFTHKNNATGGYDQWAIRGQLLWAPIDDFSALLNLHYQHLDGTPADLPGQHHPEGHQRLRARLQARRDRPGRRARAPCRRSNPPAPT
jgi:iron complex outermembrane receptor protein